MPPSSGSADPADSLVRAAAATLYAGTPAEFIATRTALVKDAKAKGDKDAAKDIGGLRKPSVAAWALNQVVHSQDPVITTLANLGSRLRHATSALDAAAIAGMRGERDQVLSNLVSTARDLAAENGTRLTATVEAEVRDTGIAALADETAQEVLASGTLTRALSYSGFGEVDLSEAAATTSTGVVLTSLPGGRSAKDRTKDGEEDEDVDDATDEAAADGESNEDDATDDDAEVADEEVADEEVADEEVADEEVADEEDGAQALAEAAAAEERARRIEQAEGAVETADKEIGRHRAAVEGARNRTDATRQRVQKLEAQLEKARAEDDLALEKLAEALSAAKAAEKNLGAARDALTELTEFTN